MMQNAHRNLKHWKPEEVLCNFHQSSLLLSHIQFRHPLFKRLFGDADGGSNTHALE